MSVGHGMQDAAKTMGIIVLALYVGGYQDRRPTSRWWVYFLTAAVLAAGHLRRRLADHPHPRPPDHRPRPAAGLRRRDGGHACCTSPPSATARRSPPPTRSPRRSWASARPSGSPAVRWGVAGNIVDGLGPHHPRRRPGRRRHLRSSTSSSRPPTRPSSPHPTATPTTLPGDHATLGILSITAGQRPPLPGDHAAVGILAEARAAEGLCG